LGHGRDGRSPCWTRPGRYGIKVINGFWLGQTTDYVNDSAYKSSTLTSILQWVNTYKNNPSVLMWDIGNEVLLNLPHVYSGAQLVAEDNAYTQVCQPGRQQRSIRRTRTTR